MSYTKKTWVTGEVIDATKLNHMEDGIVDAEQNGGATTLNELTDVSMGTPVNGQVLTFDSNAYKWKNMNPKGNYEDVIDTSNNSQLSKKASALYDYVQSNLVCINPTMNTAFVGKPTIYAGIYPLTNAYLDYGTYYFVFGQYVYSATANNYPSYQGGLGGFEYTNIIKSDDMTKLKVRAIDIEADKETTPYCIIITSNTNTNNADGQYTLRPGLYPLTKTWTNGVGGYFYAFGNACYYASSITAVPTLDRRYPTLSEIGAVKFATNPTNGQYLMYNGTNWVNSAVTLPDYVSYAYAQLQYGYNDDYQTNLLVMNVTGAMYYEQASAIVDYIQKSVCNGLITVDTGDVYAITSIETVNDKYVIHTTSNSYTFVENNDGMFVLQ